MDLGRGGNQHIRCSRFGNSRRSQIRLSSRIESAKDPFRCRDREPRSVRGEGRIEAVSLKRKRLLPLLPESSCASSCWCRRTAVLHLHREPRPAAADDFGRHNHARPLDQPRDGPRRGVAWWDRFACRLASDQRIESNCGFRSPFLTPCWIRLPSIGTSRKARASSASHNERLSRDGRSSFFQGCCSLVV